MRRHPDQQPATATRDRILNAAIQRFSDHSYEATGLRDIAADVGVDVAYVHRSFGSKERLFAEALAATIEPAKLLDCPAEQLATELAKQLVSRDAARRRSPVTPLDIVVRSLSSPDASRVVREFIMKDFIKPLSGKLEQPAAARAAVIVAFLAGLGILRNVLRVTPLLETGGGDIEQLIVGALSKTINASVGDRRAS